MTMLESKKVFEDALFNKKPLPYDAMINGYVAIQNYLARCENNNDLIDKEDDKSDDLRTLLRKEILCGNKISI